MIYLDQKSAGMQVSPPASKMQCRIAMFILVIDVEGPVRALRQEEFEQGRSTHEAV